MRLLLLACAILLGSFAFAENMKAPAKCSVCAQLDGIYEKYGTEAKKPRPDFNDLQLEASAIVYDQAAKNGQRLTSAEILSFVKVLSVAVPVDPGRSILENTAKVVEKNRKEIEAEVRKLPKEKSEELLAAIDVSIRSLTEPPDSPPPKKKGK